MLKRDMEPCLWTHPSKAGVSKLSPGGSHSASARTAGGHGGGQGGACCARVCARFSFLFFGSIRPIFPEPSITPRPLFRFSVFADCVFFSSFFFFLETLSMVEDPKHNSSPFKKEGTLCKREAHSATSAFGSLRLRLQRSRAWQSTWRSRGLGQFV